MRILEKRQILLFHKRLTGLYGGKCGVRDEALLDSALSAPFQTFGGRDLYPTALQKIVRTGCGLIKNHPFFDGNKRIGAHAMLALLKCNNIRLDYDAAELTDIIMQTADGSAGEQELLKWVREHVINLTEAEAVK